jgi:hypothetical protein
LTRAPDCKQRFANGAPEWPGRNVLLPLWMIVLGIALVTRQRTAER